MQQELLTQEGVNSKVKDLLGLGKAALENELAAISSDLKQWTRTNFDLTGLQDSYLDGLPSTYLDLLSAELVKALRNRLPVTLTKDGEIIDRSSKFFRFESTIIATFTTGLREEISGELKLRIGHT
ncbi:hypothetical protein [Pedobacter sp. ASV28]|uniref:hypothetical protein n=1 Tax=Pedobacter sp. ASV28 TaxID=2795123 RepID=UPI0018EC1723|nr:hypothetical protein [Pedobacter sp. ASV28]